jgi:hypothetical protein
MSTPSAATAVGYAGGIGVTRSKAAREVEEGPQLSAVKQASVASPHGWLEHGELAKKQGAGSTEGIKKEATQ